MDDDVDDLDGDDDYAGDDDDNDVSNDDYDEDDNDDDDEERKEGDDDDNDDDHGVTMMMIVRRIGAHPYNCVVIFGFQLHGIAFLPSSAQLANQSRQLGWLVLLPQSPLPDRQA